MALQRGAFLPGRGDGGHSLRSAFEKWRVWLGFCDLGGLGLFLQFFRVVGLQVGPKMNETLES